MTRNEVTELIILQKMVKQLTWPQLAEVSFIRLFLPGRDRLDQSTQQIDQVHVSF